MLFYAAFFTFSTWQWFITDDLFGIFKLMMTYNTNYLLFVYFFVGFLIVDAGLEGVYRLIE